MKTPKAPTPPDPNVTAQAQTKSNVNTAVANTVMGNANEVSPTGSVQYRITGYQDVGGQKVPQYERVTSLSPEQQKLYNQQVGLGSQMNTIAKNQLNNLNSTLSKPITLDGLPDMPEYDRQHFEDAIYGRMQPQLDRDRAAIESKLATQGVMPGSEAYREAMALADRQANDARYGAVLNAGQYAGQEMGVAGTARERALQEQLAVRNQPINEIAALMNGGQVTMPQFTQFQGGNVAGTDVAGITQNAYNQQMQAYQQQQASRNGMLGGIAGLAGSILTAPMTGGGSLAGAMFGGLGRL